MVLEDALKTGYGVTTTKSRLVLRSGYDMPETYVENVSARNHSWFGKIVGLHLKCLHMTQMGYLNQQMGL